MISSAFVRGTSGLDLSVNQLRVEMNRKEFLGGQFVFDIVLFAGSFPSLLRQPTVCTPKIDISNQWGHCHPNQQTLMWTQTTVLPNKHERNLCVCANATSAMPLFKFKR